MDNVQEGTDEVMLSCTFELGDLIDQMTHLKLQRKHHEDLAADFATKISKIEEQIIHALADAKLESADHGGTRVTPKEHVYAHVEDWERFYQFLHDEQYYHLLERRVSVTGYRELLDLGREVPGVVPFKKLKLSVTKSAR